MCRVEVYLGLGTNIGDRKANLDEALDRLDTLLGCHYSALSGFVETEPWGFFSDGKFLNRIIDIDILMIGDWIIDEPDLKVPHPLMRERDFVMIPLRQIASGYFDN